jgi:predicted aspartyl protease
MQRAALCLLICLLAGCAEHMPPTVAACSINKVAELPVRLAGGGVLIPASINHTAVQMELDTGAEMTTVTPAMASELRLPPDARRRTVVHATGGDVTSRNQLVWNFEIGHQLWQNQSFTLVDLARTLNEDPPVASLLGADLLSEFDVELDLPHDRVVLWQVRGCSGDFAWPDVPHSRLALQRHPPNRLVTPVHVQGQPLTALIDWGANSTVMGEAAAERLGITLDMLNTDPSGHQNGADRRQGVIHLHRFADVQIGPERFQMLRIGVAPIHVRDADILLGIDYARRRHLWLSYATGQLFVILPPRTPEAQPRT